MSSDRLEALLEQEKRANQELSAFTNDMRNSGPGTRNATESSYIFTRQNATSS